MVAAYKLVALLVARDNVHGSIVNFPQKTVDYRTLPNDFPPRVGRLAENHIRDFMLFSELWKFVRYIATFQLHNFRPEPEL